jgi:hypothetical protein
LPIADCGLAIHWAMANLAIAVFDCGNAAFSMPGCANAPIRNAPLAESSIAQ